jgi:hypothetical protein
MTGWWVKMTRSQNTAKISGAYLGATRTTPYFKIKAQGAKIKVQHIFKQTQKFF